MYNTHLLACFSCLLAACATEAFKLATRYIRGLYIYLMGVYNCICHSSCSKPLQNYMVFNDTEGVYSYTFEYEKKVN